MRDTYQISPVVTAGAAWHTDLLTLTADGDLTETKGFKSEENSQYVGVGARSYSLELAGGSRRLPGRREEQ